MSNHPKQERTVVLVKPDGVKRGLIGEVIHRFEQRGLKVIALTMVIPTQQQAHDHYPHTEVWYRGMGEKTLENLQKYGRDPKVLLGTDDPLEIGKEIGKWNEDFLKVGPVVAMIIEGVHAIDMVRKIVGHTLPAKAEMGTIRGDYSVDSPTLANLGKRAIHNIVHASSGASEAEHEIAHWFTPEEIHDYKRAEEDIMF